MKDTIIKGNGKSRNIKAPADMPETFEEWRNQLLAGTATLDIGLNAAGCDVVGTALSKANLLSDATKSTLKLTGSDPTVNDALNTLSQKGSPAEARVYGDIGTTVTLSQGGKTLSGTVTSAGYAILRPNELGDWTVVLTYEGQQKTKVVTLSVMGIVEIDPFVIGSTLDSTSWYDIAAVSRLGFAQNYWKVGDTKCITVNGGRYAVQIIGFDHDVLTTPTGDRTTAGITFITQACVTADSMNNNSTTVTGWKTSAMRTTKLSNIFTTLDSDLRSVMKSVDKVTSVGNQLNSLETTSDKIFLLSEVEVSGKAAESFAGEGTQYEYYAAGNGAIKKLNGVATTWWNRSPASKVSNCFVTVSSTGTSSVASASGTQGVSFAFCV